MKKELALTIIIAICSAGVAFGVCQNQISNNKENIARMETIHQKDVEDLTNKQDRTDILLNSINQNLASLNTKMDLLVSGKLKGANE